VSIQFRQRTSEAPS